MPRVWKELPEGELMGPIAFAFTPGRRKSKPLPGDEPTHSSPEAVGDTAKPRRRKAKKKDA